MSKYYAILTQIGAAKLANAAALGQQLEITHMAVGDGNGSETKPNASQTALINECYRAQLNSLSIDENNLNQIIAEHIISESVGGWYIREFGLYDSAGDLIAVANAPESYKPQLQEGSGRTQLVRMVLIVSNADSVTLKIDPAVVLATRQYVDKAIEAHQQSRNHPDASITTKGFVQLSSAVTSDSEEKAATSRAVKKVYDLAASKLSSVPNSSLNQAGIVQLSNAIDSNSETTAATSKAVQSLRSELKSTPFLPDFASFNIENGIYHALGDGTTSPSLNGPVGTGNNVLTVTVRNRGKSVVHFEVIQNSHDAPVKWIGECFGQNPAIYWTKVITTSNIVEFMPAGIPHPWPSTSIPKGYLKCNGAAFDKIKYPELAKAYPSGVLPDLRGEFIRGWDDGRGVDAGRGVLSSQGDAIRNITGSFGNIMWPVGQSGGVGAGVFLAGQNLHGTAFEATEQSTVNKGVGLDGILFNASRVVPTANENRPRNIAFLYIVRAA